MKNDYSKPKLYPINRDTKKLWFVAFRFTNPKNGERKQFQFRGDINQYKKKRERIIEGNALCEALYLMLKDGWNPFTGDTKESDNKTLYELLDDMLAIKKSTLKPKSYRTYYDAKNMLQRWMVKRKMKILMPYSFKTKHARQYADYLY